MIPKQVCSHVSSKDPEFNSGSLLLYNYLLALAMQYFTILTWLDTKQSFKTCELEAWCEHKCFFLAFKTCIILGAHTISWLSSVCILQWTFSNRRRHRNKVHSGENQGNELMKENIGVTVKRVSPHTTSLSSSINSQQLSAPFLYIRKSPSCVTITFLKELSNFFHIRDPTSCMYIHTHYI